MRRFRRYKDHLTTLPLINAQVKQLSSPGAEERNAHLIGLAKQRDLQWKEYKETALNQKEIWAVLIADALREAIIERKLENKFVYVHEAVSDGAPFQFLLPFGPGGSKPISYYCVAGGSLGWSMPASLGIKLENETIQGIETQLVINAVGDGSSLFYPQTYWTAAHEKLAILYIITNNQEYHTLQLGLQQVIGAYGSAPGYEWHPKTTTPEYLTINRPQFDFVALAKAFGNEDGEMIKDPEAVRDAVFRGIDFVLTKNKSYILDMRTAQVTPATGETTKERIFKRYIAQPPLDIFHKQKKLMKMARSISTEIPANIPVLP